MSVYSSFRQGGYCLTRSASSCTCFCALVVTLLAFSSSNAFLSSCTCLYSATRAALVFSIVDSLSTATILYPSSFPFFLGSVPALVALSHIVNNNAVKFVPLYSLCVLYK